MAIPVIIVESAAKAKTLEAQLGGAVETILIQSAPVRAVYVSSPDEMHSEKSNFDFVPEARGKIFLDSLSACQGREIYLALDGDWRGNFWAWLINGYWARSVPGSMQMKRLNLFGLAGEALHGSLRRLEPISDEQGLATYIRMLFESSLGRHLQRLLGSSSGPNGLPLNYSSLTALFLLAEREVEIRLYTPIVKWKIKVRVGSGTGDCLLSLKEAPGVTGDGLLRQEQEVHAAVNLFKRGSFQVRTVTETLLAVAPSEPYHFMELLRDGVVQGGLSPLAAMTAIRNLYYGVQVDGRWLGLITAFLPLAMEQDDSVVLMGKIREQIGARIGEASLGPESGAKNTRGMILPVDPALGPEELAGKLGAAEDKIYRLVWAKALASQMSEAQGKLLTVMVAAGEGCIFQGTAKVLTDQGFLAVYSGCQAHELLESPSPLAVVQPGQTLPCLQIIPEKNTGLPPEYYSFEGLATDLADFSLEIDGMSVAMLQQMLDNNYLMLMPDGSFRCAENTIKLVNVMNRAFPTMKGIQLSAYLAQTIEEAVSGRKPLAFALKQFEQTMMMRGEVLVKTAVPVATQKRGLSSRNVIRMPEEGRPAKVKEVEEGSAQEASFVAEEDYPVNEVVEAVENQSPEIDSAQEEEREVVVQDEPAVTEQVVSPELAAATEKMFAEADTASDEVISPALPSGSATAEPVKVCPDCSRPLLLKEDRFGKYWFCSGHPECRHSESYEKDGGPELPCPLCRIGGVVTKHTPTGKIFYVCPEQDCEFMAWSKPHAIACQVCDSPFLVEKKNLDGRISLRCPKAGCTFTQPLSEKVGAQQGVAVEAPLKKKVLVRRVASGSGGLGGATKKVRIVRR